MPKKLQTFETAFDLYTVESQLGEGGSGAVYAVLASDGNKYALKLLKPGVSQSLKLSRFKNEIDFCSKCIHPNILRVLDSGFTGSGTSKSLFYVMPLYSSTLRQEMKKGIPHEKTLQVFARILDGVEAAHLLDVVHRDLKPENILCKGALNELVIADFGIAHFSEDNMITHVETKPTERLANFQYASPEQRKPGEKVDLRADIFALGLILNELFTGHIPHGSNFTKIASKAPNFAYLDQLVDQMIQQSPVDRPKSIEDIKKELLRRKNEYVYMQKIDEVKRQVTPTTTVPLFEPIGIKSVDLINNELILKLKNNPPSEWIQIFFDQPGGFSYTVGCEPSYFKFHGTSCQVQLRLNNPQLYIEHFKNYAAKANEHYPILQRKLAERRDAELRKQLQQQFESEQRRLELLRSLKF